jgi:hypothetical protein
MPSAFLSGSIGIESLNRKIQSLESDVEGLTAEVILPNGGIGDSRHYL